MFIKFLPLYPIETTENVICLNPCDLAVPPLGGGGGCLYRLLYILHQSHRNVIRSSFKITFCINPNDWFSITCPEMNPVIIKFYFQSINFIDGIVMVFIFYLFKYCLYINAFFKYNFIFTYKIVRISVA